MTITQDGPDPDSYAGTHITFTMHGMSKSGKTGVWEVFAKRGPYLGLVKFFGRWRKYSFYPAPDCVFEETCLNEIAEFIKARTHDQRVGI